MPPTRVSGLRGTEARRAMSNVLESGWAVRISPFQTARAWLNASGGYVATRAGRMVWHDYDDALDQSHKWDACDPVLVRIRFKRVSQRQRPDPK